MIVRKQEHLVFEDPWIKVWEDDVVFPDGSEGKWAHIWRRDSAVVIPMFSETEFLLLRQWRYPVRQEVWDFPVGAVEDGDTPEETAQRELEEETGYRADTISALGSFRINPGLSAETVYVFVAQGLHKTDTPQHGHEIIVVQQKTFAQIQEIVSADLTCSGWFLSAWAKFLSWKK